MIKGLKYIDDVRTGKINAGHLERAAVDRYLKDRERDDLVFREDEVHTVIDFIALLKHGAGKFKGEHFILEGWQEFIIMNLYGFFWKGTALRRFNDSYIEVARKNGKTALSAALSLYHLIADGEGEAEVLLAANSKDQAQIAFKMTKRFVTKLDPTEEHLRAFRADILLDETDSMLKVLASDSSKLDGYNCSFGLIDEYHSASTSEVRDVIRSSQAMRENPSLVTITTAGLDKTLPCYELRTVCSEVVTGLKEDDSLFVLIFSLDEGDEWKQPSNWRKANPNLGVTVNQAFLHKQIKKAENSPSDEVGIRTKNLNQWMDSADVWIAEDYLLKSTGTVTRESFKGKDSYIGVDLASNVDLTAVAYLHVDENDFYHFRLDYYLPNQSLKTRADRDMYKQWKRLKHLTTTSGNVTDYDYITRDMLQHELESNIIEVYYDKYNSTQWAIQCTEEGIPLKPYSQTIGNFNAPTRELERLILSNRVIIDDNPITRYCFRNVELKADHNGNVKPNKGLDRKKIDGVIAMIQALAAYHDNTGTGAGQIF
jgi:phage terminase large subunit-like protein